MPAASLQLEVASRSLVPARLMGALALTLASVAGQARAQCPPAWAPGFDRTQLEQSIDASIVFDDGTGPALFFTIEADINGTSALWKWDGSRITSIGGIVGGPFGNPGIGRSLCAFDDGTGPALYVAGDFWEAGHVDATGVARWNPSTGWSAVGDLSFVNALAVFDDGTGPALYETGSWPLLSRWNGSTWVDVGLITGGLNRGSQLVVHDDGTGPALYVGGSFHLPGIASSNIARFSASGWSAVGSGMNDEVWELVVHDGGAGPELYAAGGFTQADGQAANHIARWDGTAWSALGAGLSSGVLALASFDDGTGSALYAAGWLPTAGGVPTNHIARWNGAAWSALGSGLDGTGTVLQAFDDGSGSALFVGGGFTHAGGVLSPHLAKWTSSGWAEFAPGNGIDKPGNVLLVHDDGSGPELYCGGSFGVAGDVVAQRIARWNGTSWHALGGEIAYVNPSAAKVNALAPYDDGSGNGTRIYAGGLFDLPGVHTPNIAVFDGTAWTSLGGGGASASGQVFALCAFDDGNGPELYVGGEFTQMGGVSTRYVVRWNGTSWSDVGGGMQVPGDTYQRGVHALVVYDDGSGPALFAAGSFPSAGMVAGTSNLARWKNGAWHSIGAASGRVWTLKVADIGAGSKLYLGGDFGQLGGVPALLTGSFDGSGFAALGSGLDDPACALRSLAAFDDGQGGGAHLYAGGRLKTVGGLAECSLARLDGSTWTPVTTSFGGTVLDMTEYDDGHGPALYACGNFIRVDGVDSTCIGRYGPTCPDPVAFCFGTASACPCGNAGAPQNGCATSFNVNGAHLGTSGVASLSADTLTLVGTGTSNTFITYFQGTQRVNGGAGTVFGDGLRCAGGTVVRLAAVQAGGGASQYPNAQQQPVSVRGAVTAIGSKRSYQAWYRNAVAFCTPSTFNLSNGVEVTWGF